MSISCYTLSVLDEERNSEKLSRIGLDKIEEVSDDVRWNILIKDLMRKACEVGPPISGIMDYLRLAWEAIQKRWRKIQSPSKLGYERIKPNT